MLRYDFDQSLSYWVCSTAHAVERALNEELMPHGITYRQWQVLAWLALKGELSQTELADLMQIEAPTLAGIVDRMERDGWLVRRECPGDRRKKLISATERVEPVWETIAAAARRVRAVATGDYTPEQVSMLIGMLRTIQQNLGRELSPRHAPAPAADGPSAKARRGGA